MHYQLPDQIFHQNVTLSKQKEKKKRKEIYQLYKVTDYLKILIEIRKKT